MDAIIHVYTFKEGLLSKLAHDLKLGLTRFQISARGNTVEAKLDASSLKVLGTMRSGALDPAVLSGGDKEKIQQNIAREVLRTREFPEIRFQGVLMNQEAPFSLNGSLVLCGSTHPLQLSLAQRGGRLLGEVELTPSRWGIKPYKALGGTLKVQDRVVVAIDASAEFLMQGASLSPAVQLTWSAGT
jgi:hypothetical protein